MATEEMSAENLKAQETWRIMKNVVVISLSFMVQFTAYSGAANLQSSINAEAGLGTASLAAVYGGLIFSSIFLPVVVIKWLGTKWAISLSFITSMPYIAAQLYPTFYTMIPTGIIMGLGGGPMWCAKCMYLSVASEAHSAISKISPEVLLTRFLGLFFMIYQMNQVWGNLISSLVLSSGNNSAAVTSVNETMIPILCGANFLPSADAGEALPKQPPEKIQLITGIYLACAFGAAVIVAIGVDSTKRYDSGRTESGGKMSGMVLLVQTLKLMVNPTQALLIIINVFIGLQQAFFGADFTAAFVSCAVGTGSVGFVMMVYGISDAFGCVLNGYLAKLTGRLPIVCGATIIQVALFTAILVWRPHAGESYALYLIAVLWGLCDGLWVVQINSYYGVLFPGKEEAAFSNFRLWEAVGYIIAYIMSPHLRTSTKTYLILSMMIVGVSCYLVVEYQQYKIKRKLENKNKDLCSINDTNGCDNIAFQTVG